MSDEMTPDTYIIIINLIFTMVGTILTGLRFRCRCCCGEIVAFGSKKEQGGSAASSPSTESPPSTQTITKETENQGETKNIKRNSQIVVITTDKTPTSSEESPQSPVQPSSGENSPIKETTESESPNSPPQQEEIIEVENKRREAHHTLKVPSVHPSLQSSGTGTHSRTKSRSRSRSRSRTRVDKIIITQEENPLQKSEPIVTTTVNPTSKKKHSKKQHKSLELTSYASNRKI